MQIAINVEQILQRAPGGIGRYTVELLRGIQRQFPDDIVVPFTARHSVTDIEHAYRLFDLDEAHVSLPVVLPLPRPVLYDSWHLLHFPRLAWCAPSLQACDLVHAPSSAVPPTGDKPLVVTIHDAAFALFPETYPSRGRRFHRIGAEAAARRASLVITGSHSASQEIAQHTSIPIDRIRIVPYGVDHTTATPEEIAQTRWKYDLIGCPYVLWVGSLEPRKNVNTLLQAFARFVKTSSQPHHLVLAGPSGWLEKNLIRDDVRTLIGGRLHPVGRVSDVDLRSLYAGADLFAFPSLHEGFGLPVLEAMVQDTPVLCSDITALHEVAGEAALFLTPIDVEAWCDAFERLLSDPLERSRLTSAGHLRSQLFSWERTVLETRAVYEEALAER